MWDPEVGVYPWMTGEFAALLRRYDLADLRPHLIANGVAATIVVQVRADLAETVDLLELASRTAEVVGVVGWVDLTSSDVGGQLDLLRSGVGGEYLVGLRHAAADEPNPEQIYHDSRLGPDLQAALDSLPPEFRAAVVLCDIEGLSYEEIGATLGVKLGTVRSRIHRGRQALRDFLASHSGDTALSA